ncbi:MAG: trigger factor [Elusimicrobia bacterium]|nr:trigger factor [Elusimicrobiota bacterium]
MSATTAPSMKVTVVEDTPCTVKLTVEVSAADVRQETEAAYQAIRENATLPGFRAGKVPIELVKQNFSHSARRRAADRLLSLAVQQVLRDRKLQLVTDPLVDHLQFEFERPFSFQLTVEKLPTFTLKDYKHIKVVQKAREVTDERVEETLQVLRERNAQLVPVSEGTVSRNHFVVVDYAGTVEGQMIHGGSAQNVLIDMTAPQMISGLAEGILGMHRGEEKVIPVQFPENHPEKTLAGKQALFTVSVKEIKEKRVPALDDELAKDLGATSLEELRQRIRTSLQKNDQEDSQKEVEDQIAAHLLKVHTFPVPLTLVNLRLETLSTRMEEALVPRQQAGAITKEQRSQWRERLRPEAERQVHLSLILRAIAEAEHLEVTEEELRATVEASVAAHPDQREAVERSFAERRERVLAALHEQKIFQFLKDHAKLSIEKPTAGVRDETNEQTPPEGGEKPKGLRRLFSAFKKT